MSSTEGSWAFPPTVGDRQRRDIRPALLFMVPRALLMIGAITYPASSVLTWTLPGSPEALHLVLGWADAGVQWAPT